MAQNIMHYFNFSTISGTASKRSATRPTSATWNIGASGSLKMLDGDTSESSDLPC